MMLASDDDLAKVAKAEEEIKVMLERFRQYAEKKNLILKVRKNIIRDGE